jgi:hypothetical protein
MVMEMVMMETLEWGMVMGMVMMETLEWGMVMGMVMMETLHRNACVVLCLFGCLFVCFCLFVCLFVCFIFSHVEDEDFGYRLDRVPLAQGDANLLARAEVAREKLLEAVANHDDTFMDLYLASGVNARSASFGFIFSLGSGLLSFLCFSHCLDGQNIAASDIRAALKSITLARKGVVVLCGASLKNKGTEAIDNSHFCSCCCCCCCCSCFVVFVVVVVLLLLLLLLSCYCMKLSPPSCLTVRRASCA